MNKRLPVSPRALIIFAIACLIAIGIGVIQWSIQSERRHRIAQVALYKSQIEWTRQKIEALSREFQTAVEVQKLAEQYIKLAVLQKKAEKLPGLTVEERSGRESVATLDIPVKPDYTREMDKLLRQMWDLNPDITEALRKQALSDLSSWTSAISRVLEEQKITLAKLGEQHNKLRLAELDLMEKMTVEAP